MAEKKKNQSSNNKENKTKTMSKKPNHLSVN
jgi:hypothetical protein